MNKALSALGDVVLFVSVFSIGVGVVYIGMGGNTTVDNAPYPNHATTLNDTSDTSMLMTSTIDDSVTGGVNDTYRMQNADASNVQRTAYDVELQ